MPPMAMAPPLPPAQPPVVLNTMGNGAPPIIVIPSGPQELERDGYGEEYREAASGQSVMGAGNNRRRVTPRARPMSPRPNRGQDPAFSGGLVNASTRITIRKLS